jgi:ABC-2 type transport system permease protein
VSPVLTVVRREYVERVKKRWFVISTIGGPLLVIGFAIGGGLLGARSGDRNQSLAVVDETGQLYDRVAARLEDGGFEVRRHPTGDDNRAMLDRMVLEGDLGGYIVLDQETLARGRVVYRSEGNPSTLRRIALQNTLVRAVIETRFGGEGELQGIDDLLRGGDLQVELVSGRDEQGRQELRSGFAFAGAAVLYFALLFYGVQVMQAVLEEKTSRIVEVVLSSIKPWQLMLGKIIGVGLVGLTQMAVWAGLITVAGVFGLPSLIAARPELRDLGSFAELAPTLLTIVSFLVFFVLGYVLYSSLYAAVGAMCSSDEEARQAQLPVTFLIIIPFILMVGTIEGGGETTVLVALSLVPFFAPIVMFARVASGLAPFWQVALSWALMLITIGLVAWVAGRIYRVGILMQGKRPTLPELWRWVKEA